MRISYVHVWLILLIKNICVSQFHQDDYDIEQHRLEIPEYNKTACRNLTLKVFKYNDTLRMKAINFTIFLIPGARKNILLTVTLYKNVQKKYRAFPLPNITLELCDEYRKVGGNNILGLQTALTLTNFKGCPVVKGLYYLNTWIIEQDKFIPHLPGGEYMLRVHVVVDDDLFLFLAHWYGSIIKNKKRKH